MGTKTDIMKTSQAMAGLITIGGTVLGWGILLLSDFRERSQPAKALTIPLQQIEDDHAHFNRIAPTIPEYTNCVRIPVRRQGPVSIGYPLCSDLAVGLEEQSFEITDNFHVPPELPRKFTFWRKIYSKWGSSQFIVHNAAYPEVVFEILELNGAESISENLQWPLVKPVFEANKEHYRKALLSLHRRKGPAGNRSPGLLAERIVGLMAHIADPDKYLKAALTLRAQRGQKDFIRAGYDQAQRYLPHIREIFRQEGVPEELVYLAFVESSFNLRAKSKVGASGVYQIMPLTGKQYLKITETVDERNDPIKAARAAAKLLRLNHKLTKSWPLAVIAYNHGVGSVTRAVRAVGSTDIVKIVSKYDHKSFGFASKNFYFEYTAMLYTVMNIDKVFQDIPPVAPLNYQEVKLRQETRISVLAARHKTSKEVLKDLNPDITREAFRLDAMLPRGYALKIPGPVTTISQN